MAVWPWLREQLDNDWPTRCPQCGGGLVVTWLTTTTRPADGAPRPGVGLTCSDCQRDYDWSDEDGYGLRRRRFGRGRLDPSARPEG